MQGGDSRWDRWGRGKTNGNPCVISQGLGPGPGYLSRRGTTALTVGQSQEAEGLQARTHQGWRPRFDLARATRGDCRGLSQPPTATRGKQCPPLQRTAPETGLASQGPPTPAPGRAVKTASPSAHHLPRWEQRQEVGTEGTWPQAQTPSSPLGLPF